MAPEAPRLRLRPDVRYRHVAGEGVVLCQEAGEVLVLNETGIRIVTLLGQGLSPAGIVARLQAELDADPQRLAADVDAFLSELRAAGVLEEETG